MAGLLDQSGAFVGYPQLQRQAARMRVAAQGRIPENLPDPRTYGFVSGLLGTSPDELGMSVMSPNTQAAKEAAYYGYQLGNAAQIAPVVTPAARAFGRGLMTLGPSEAAAISNPMAQIGGVTTSLKKNITKSVYPQEQALKLAQERAALPVEQGGLGLPSNNTAMDRAGAMGFDTDVYHGTKADILIFDPTKPVFSTPNYEIANLYSQGANANIIPLMLRGKELSISDLNKSGVSGSFAENLAKRLGVYDKNDPFNLSDIRERELINQLPKYGIDRLKVTDMSDMGGIQTQYATPSSSSNIRSRFAAFDPFRKDVATATAMGVALPDLLAAEYNQQPQSAGLLYPLP